MDELTLSQLNSEKQMAILKGLPQFSRMLAMIYQGVEVSNQRFHSLLVYDDKSADLSVEDFKVLVDVWGEALSGMSDILLMVKAGNPDGLSAIVESTTDKVKDLMERFKGSSE